MLGTESHQGTVRVELVTGHVGHRERVVSLFAELFETSSTRDWGRPKPADEVHEREIGGRKLELGYGANIKFHFS